MYLIDTNVLSLAMNGRSPRAVQFLSQTPREHIAISVITEMELRFGVEKHANPYRLKAIVDKMLRTLRVLPLPEDIAATYGRLRARLETRGRPIGALDTIIASHAIAIRAVLVTNNTKEFGRVAGLRCEDWTR